MKTALIRISLGAAAVLVLSAFVLPTDDAVPAQEARALPASQAWRMAQAQTPSPDLTISWHAVLAGKR